MGCPPAARPGSLSGASAVRAGARLSGGQSVSCAAWEEVREAVSATCRHGQPPIADRAAHQGLRRARQGPCGSTFRPVLTTPPRQLGACRGGPHAWRPVAVRYYLGAVLYRSTLEFSPSALDEATAAYERIEHFVRRANAWVGDGTPRQNNFLPGAFTTALDNDLGVPDALSVIHSTVRGGNVALEAGDKDVVQGALNDVLQMRKSSGSAPGMERPETQPVR